MAHVWWHATIRLSRIPTHHTQILTPVQDPDASHAKPCAVNPYAREAFHQCQQFLTPVQPLKASHTKSLRLYRFPTIQIISYDGHPRNSSDTSLCRCRHPALHMQILTLVQVPTNSNNYLRQGRPLKIHMQILMLVQVPNPSHTNS
ncbi:hypothetical protein O181_027461 [Austropuccinia psidii MF-1]|uniref:Uncharacterized protein n=1 Tax=Austropuccinia psidii MF-1 TaxID=1389203 RepID=A0A9Q3CSJ0_9BASI|nr:hypothetical protein [Austropuccinia psidii MF-1]